MFGKEFVSWEDVNLYINSLINDIKANKNNTLYDLYAKNKITGVYGIPRGGLVLAIILSYKLHIPLLMAPSENCIIIDDIADSGRSLSHYVENDTQFNNYFITTMYYKKRSCVIPNFYLLEKDESWIVFPWEDQKTEGENK